MLLSQSDPGREDVEPAPIRARNSVDVLLRTQQQAALALSAMADGKANIILTITSVVLTLSVSQFGNEQFQTTAFVGSGFSLVALMLAIVAVLPVRGSTGRELARKRSVPGSALFFGYVAELPLERYWGELSNVLADDADLYEAVAANLHAQANVLRHKYRYLRASYLVFLVGAVSAAVVGSFDIVVR